MSTRQGFTFWLLFLLVAVVPPSIWAPEELCYWLDGYRPLSPYEAALEMGGTKCYGMYCSQVPSSPCPTGPAGQWGCAGRTVLTCTTVGECISCTGPRTTLIRPCRPGFPENWCEQLTYDGTCGTKLTRPCTWLPPTGPCICSAAAFTFWPGTNCPVGNCTSGIN